MKKWFALFVLLCSVLSSEEYYSQLGQDRYLNEHFFKDKRDGIFIDIGAYDGVTGSNTLFFEKFRGWKGICVEPVPEFFARLEQHRSCILINAAIGSKGEKEFLWIKGVNEQLSGLVETYDTSRKKLVEGQETLLTVPSIPFMELLESYQISHIDYLSIDTEGGELNILKSIDFDRVSIDVIDVENNAKDPSFAKFLAERGYQKVAHLSVDEIYLPCKNLTEGVFNQIYADAIWGKNSEGYGTSGSGSTLENTTVYREFLTSFLRTYKIHSVVDIGCGDWSFSKEIPWGDIAYTGIDIVKTLIEKNERLYGKKNISFIHADLIRDDLPKADLLICKDVLQHLTNEQIMTFLAKIKDYRYCLLINGIYPETLSSHNPDIETGGYRPLDLTKPPFNLNGMKVLILKSVEGNYYHLKQVLLVSNDDQP